jgi:hypothetical protein
MKQDIQSFFFDKVKQQANPGFSLVDEIADLLQISNDSAYRRLRGETAITLAEAATLGRHFGVSLEEISPGKADSILFSRSTFRDQSLEFDEYLIKTESYLQRIADTKEKHGIYAAKDIPIFHHFQVPEMGMFKLFFWLKTIRGNQAIDAVKFDFNIIPPELMKKSRALAKIYFQIPFTEIWNEDTSNAALRQIEYFYEAGWLANKSVAVKLCDKVEEVISIIHKQAETGMKWFDGKPVHPDVSYELYHNDLVGLDNSIYVKTDQFPMSMIGYNELDYLFTSHAGFCHEAETFLVKQIGKSMLLSGASERERNQFFNKIYEKIHVLKAKIIAS